MEIGILNLLVTVAAVLVVVLSFATFILLFRLYKMHDVKNQDGEYAWMVPSSYAELQKDISESQRLIVGSLGELTVHNKQVAKLMESLVNATLSMRQEMNGDKKD